MSLAVSQCMCVYIYIYIVAGVRLDESGSQSMYMCIYIYIVAGVRLDESGWAMLVAGSRLLIWRYCSNQLSVSSVHEYSLLPDDVITRRHGGTDDV